MMNNYFINWIPSFLFIVFTLSFIIKIWNMNATKKKSHPPGPWKLPIIGNLHQLMMGGSLPHHTLKSLSQKYGDLMHLQLGEISTIVVSSPRVAKAVLKTHDLAFANRPEIMLGKIVAYDYADIAFSPYGEYWRQLRKICFLELLSTKSVRSLISIRQDEALKLVSSIREEALLRSKHGVNMTRKISSYTSSMVCRAAFGRGFGRHQGELIELLKEVLILGGGFDVSEIFPSWKILHYYLSSNPKLVELHRKIDDILEIILQEHVENPSGKNGEFGQEDLIDVLMRIKRSEGLNSPITNRTIKAIILDMFTGGTDTSATTVEWAMAEIIRNPNVLEKLQNEIKGVTLPEKKIIEETDIQKLNYLKMVIKETLRLHPPLPLLVPRESREQCKIDGYIIPPKTRVIVNAWAIGRESEYWDEPENFIPERFENNFTDFMGNDCEYLPFGIGRRSCPGMSFALANVEVPLANMLFYFDWKLPNDINGTNLDMSETHGITAPRKNQLFLVPSMYEESFNKL